MDRYFYILEEENGEKIIHLEGNLYNVGNESDEEYTLTEWSGLYISLAKAQEMLKNDDEFFATVDELVKYAGNMTEADAMKVKDTYFNGNSGVPFDIADITDKTPCGDYYFDRSYNFLFQGVEFNDTTQDEVSHWAGICQECVTKHNISEKYLDEGGSGICGVAGCSNEADYYIDFK